MTNLNQMAPNTGTVNPVDGEIVRNPWQQARAIRELKDSRAAQEARMAEIAARRAAMTPEELEAERRTFGPPDDEAKVN